eukprot:6432036-Pyramimonas_sp.AAC.1
MSLSASLPAPRTLISMRFAHVHTWPWSWRAVAGAAVTRKIARPSIALLTACEEVSNLSISLAR